MTTDLNTQPLSQPSFSDRLTLAFIRLAKIFVRILFVVVLAAALGVGLYLGIPRLYQDYIQPVQDHTVQIADLNVRQDEIAVTVEDDLTNFQDRLGNLEVQNESESEQLGELVARQDELEAALDLQVELARRIAAIEEDLTALANVNEQQETSITALAEGLDANDTPIAVLEREVQIAKALALIARARLDIGQANAGLAELNILVAQEILDKVSQTAPEDDLPRLTQAMERLELALSHLGEMPLVAANDLDAAWTILATDGSEAAPNP